MDFLAEVNEKYSELQAKVDKKLQTIEIEEKKIEKIMQTQQTAKNQNMQKLTFEQALKRNAQLLKSLEMTKARLRSRSAFSPVEQILQTSLENYKRDIFGTEQTEANKAEKFANFV